MLRRNWQYWGFPPETRQARACCECFLLSCLLCDLCGVRCVIIIVVVVWRGRRGRGCRNCGGKRSLQTTGRQEFGIILFCCAEK